MNLAFSLLFKGVGRAAPSSRARGGAPQKGEVRQFGKFKPRTPRRPRWVHRESFNSHWCCLSCLLVLFCFLLCVLETWNCLAFHGIWSFWGTLFVVVLFLEKIHFVRPRPPKVGKKRTKTIYLVKNARNAEKHWAEKK